MRRALVLTSEGARHWMRAQIPHRRAFFADMPTPASFDWKLTASDVRGVATTYFATLVAVLAFLI
ncbi:hypothetical protein LCM19_02470 [Qipengyuania flava]|nr:hypothetical protein [Qipengyuania flava]